MVLKSAGSAGHDIRSSVEPSVRRIARERKIENFGKRNIDDFVGISKERVEEKTLYVPISSAIAGTRIVEKRIRTEIIGDAEEKYGILSEKEYFEGSNGKTTKHLQATFIKDKKIVKMDVEYDITSLVDAGAKASELPILEFIADREGTLVYASREYDENIDSYKRKTGYDKGVYRDKVIGKFKLWSFMQGKQMEIMESIFSDSRKGFHIVREINVPFFLSFGLHCKNSNMTNVVISYCFQDGMLFYGAINNSQQSNREWRSVWSTITSRKKYRIRLIKPFRINNEIERSRINGGNALPFLAMGFRAMFPLANGSAEIQGKDEGHERIYGNLERESRIKKEMQAKLENRRTESAGIQIIRNNISRNLLANMAGTSNAALTLKEAKERAIERITAKSLEGLRVAIASSARNAQVVRSIYLSRAKNHMVTLDVARAAILHRSPIAVNARTRATAKSIAVSKAMATDRLAAAARARSVSRVKAKQTNVAQIAENRINAVNSSIRGILLYLDNEIKRIEESIRRRIDVIMFRIFSYITFGIRNYAEIRKVSYYSYVKSF